MRKYISLVILFLLLFMLFYALIVCKEAKLRITLIISSIIGITGLLLLLYFLK